MTIGTSIFLIAVGAIMRYAIVDRIANVNLSVAGLILIVVGVLGLLIGLFQTAAWRDRGPRDEPYR